MSSSHYRWAFTPLSPIHVGTGEVFEPTQYVVAQGSLCEFDTVTLSQVLQEKDRRELLGIVTNKDNTQMMLAVQRFFVNRRDRLLPVARQRIPLSTGYQELYESRIGRVMANQGADRKIFNSLSIKRAAYRMVDGLPYLPGSSIKGAIRTALLHRVNGGQRSRAEDHDGLHSLQSRLLDYRSAQGTSWRLEKDPLRQLRIGDAIPVDATVQRRVYQAVNRKKTPLTVRQPDHRGQSERTSPDEYLECVLPQNRAFTATVEVQNLAQGLNHRFPERTPRRSFSAEEIANACNAFYRTEILQQELAQMRERGYVDPAWQSAIDEFLANNAALMSAGKGFLLRIGHHSGAEAVTLPGMRRIKILRKPPSDRATTWWMAAEQGKEQVRQLLPFGWVFVEVQEVTAENPDWQGRSFAYKVASPDPVPETMVAPAVPKSELWEGRIKYRRQNATLSTVDDRASATGDVAQRLMEALPKDVQRKLQENQCFQKFRVTIEDRQIVALEQLL
jgi:CRISPR-associated protein Csm5